MSYDIRLRRKVKEKLSKNLFSPLELSRMTVGQFNREFDVSLNWVPPRSTLHSWLKMDLEKKEPFKFRLNRISVRRELYDMIPFLMDHYSLRDRSSAHRKAIEISENRTMDSSVDDGALFTVLFQYEPGCRLSSLRCHGKHKHILKRNDKFGTLSGMMSHRLCLEICLEYHRNRTNRRI